MAQLFENAVAMCKAMNVPSRPRLMVWPSVRRHRESTHIFFDLADQHAWSLPTNIVSFASE